jgi:hypothetical protein
MQLPFMHMPSAFEQAVLVATQVRPPPPPPAGTQQPPAAHSLPSQHGWPVPPHAVHCVPPPAIGAQVRPIAVQKPPKPPRPPQQAWPLAPQLVVLPPAVTAQLESAHAEVTVPPPGTVKPQLPGVAAQEPPTQQPPVEQVSLAQHGWPAAPHVVAVPLKQTCAPTASPEATHFVELGSQQPPPEHIEPGQQVWPGAPQTVHMPPVQAPPVEQLLAEATQ